MSVQPAPICDSAIFNATCWIGETLTGNFVEFPVAQGDNTLQNVTTSNITATGSVDITGGLIVDGESTLVAGVLTNNINSIANTDSISFGSDNSARTGNTNIGASNVNTKIFIDTSSTANTNSNPAISIGTSTSQKTIKIGNSADATSSSVHLSQIDIKGHQINNIVNTTGDVDIAPLQTTGILNIGTAVTKTTAINIGCNTGIVFSALPINIGNKSSGIVNIGQATTGVTFNSQAGTAGQLLSSNGTGIPTWINAPVGITFLTGIITPGVSLSGSVTFSTAFATTPKIILTGFVTSGTTIIVVGVSSKSTTGFTWLASSTGLTGIDYFAVV